jgi:uncharacterized protein YyaL (SSP411 family)
VWNPQQIRAVLSGVEHDVLVRRYGLDGPGNFVDPHAETPEAQWHLHSYRSFDDIANELSISADDAEHELQHARHKLLAVRTQRVAPALDNKILTAWNALTISALAQTSRALQEPRLADAACAALDQIRQFAWRDSQLYAVQAGGLTQFPAYLDDYAYLLDACIEVLQTRWRSEDLNFACALADVLLTRFADSERGGFYFTANDHEALIHRPKSFADEATPSGNAVAALALQRLGWLLGDTRYLHAAEQTLRADWPALQDHPSAHATLLMALDEYLHPPQLVIIRGHDNEVSEWQLELNKLYQPRRLVFGINRDAVLPEVLAAKATQSNTVAYVCRGTTCDPPVTALAALIALTR